MLSVRIFGIEDALLKAATLRIPGSQLAGALERWALYALEPEIQKNLAGRVLHRRTGHLAQRVALPIARTKGGSSVTIQTRGIPYAFIHEYGGTIVPVKAKMLTVPLKAAMTPAGVLRKSAREWANTWMLKSKAGNLLIMRTKSGGDIEPLFVLKRKVVIKASEWAGKAVNATLDDLDKELETLIDDTLKSKKK